MLAALLSLLLACNSGPAPAAAGPDAESWLEPHGYQAEVAARSQHSERLPAELEGQVAAVLGVQLQVQSLPGGCVTAKVKMRPSHDLACCTGAVTRVHLLLCFAQAPMQSQAQHML